MPSMGKAVSDPSPNSLAVLLSPGNSDGQVLGLDRYGSGQSEIQVSADSFSVEFECPNGLKRQMERPKMFHGIYGRMRFPNPR